MRPTESIQTISFSPDYSFIDVGTNEGFRIYSSDPSAKVHSEHLRGKPHF